MNMKRIKLGNTRKMGAGSESKTLFSMYFFNKIIGFVVRAMGNITFHGDSLIVLHGVLPPKYWDWKKPVSLAHCFIFELKAR